MLIYEFYTKFSGFMMSLFMDSTNWYSTTKSKYDYIKDKNKVYDLKKMRNNWDHR